jgi:hypothetical protein
MDFVSAASQFKDASDYRHSTQLTIFFDVQQDKKCVLPEATRERRERLSAEHKVFFAFQ